MIGSVALLLGGLSASGILAWRWGPPQEHWPLTSVFSAFAIFVGLAGLAGSAFARMWSGEWVPDTTDLVPGLAGTALASVAVSVVVLRRARLQPLGFQHAPTWAWGWSVAGIPAFLTVSAAWATAIEWAGVPFESQQLLQLLGDGPRERPGNVPRAPFFRRTGEDVQRGAWAGSPFGGGTESPDSCRERDPGSCFGDGQNPL